MILQLKREEENLCGHRGLLSGSDRTCFTIIAPRNLRIFYEKLMGKTNKIGHVHQQFNQNIKFDQSFEKLVLTYSNVNRFFAAFIDHVRRITFLLFRNVKCKLIFQALKDVDYEVKEKNLFENLFDCEINSNVTDSKGVFYFDSHASFSKVMLYGNENSLFSFEYLLFLVIFFTSGNFLMAIISVGIIAKLKKAFLNYLTKNNLACKTLIDKRFLI